MATSSQTQEVHGHAVLQMMLDSGQAYSRDSLLAAISKTFGENARFVICSGGNMTAGELIDTLAERGKFTGPKDAFKFKTGTMCDH